MIKETGPWKRNTMLLKLFAAFTLIPMLELYLLIEVGAVIGPLCTVLLVVATGFVGAFLARMQGIQTMARVRSSLAQGTMPAEDLMDALLIFVAGVLLITPGFLTDITGLLILFHPSRSRIKYFLKKKFSQWIQEQNIHFDIHQ